MISLSLGEAPINPHRIGTDRARICSQPGLQVVGHPKGVGDDGKRRIDGRTRWKETAIDDVKIIHFVAAAIQVKRRAGWVGAEPDRAVLMAGRRDRQPLR